MHEIRQGFLDGDKEEGNGGIEVLQKLIEFCRHPHPANFVSMREYLDYRFDDIANGYSIFVSFPPYSYHTNHG